MSLRPRIDTAVERALVRAGSGAPPRLDAALRHAVLPGGARIRPTICLSVATACGDPDPVAADAAAAAVELIHCASLVHDDLPAFDDADMRRGKPSVHRAFSEALAVLAGDTLIVQGFAELAHTSPALIVEMATRTGSPHGICAGQAWESEDQIDLSTYHRAKTGALFVAATRMGAIAARQDPEPWTELGARIGEAFQVADDLLDALSPEAETGKPQGQDAALGRPSAVTELGVPGAIRRLEDILSGAIASIPACPGEAMLAAMVRATAEKLTPAHSTVTAAE
ncbi:polyprenyl synthetase family protein [Jannaschia sp. Os4]|uniref:polyprenyl synthetase family protein n=1 Tax=Jannaschia sp. Os4 TaxID=2807617 RepID=UPI0019392D25|nr:polyprenyl synthetase family protein [Jannaschia sp. Os4]MBM2575529.1 polyprenyl synthetase family protein [Jannaschia sp. Os4]